MVTKEEKEDKEQEGMLHFKNILIEFLLAALYTFI